MRRAALIIIFVAFSLLYLLYGRNCAPVVSSICKALPLLALIVFMIFSLSGTDDRKGLVICLLAILFSIMGDTAGEFKGTGGGDLPFILQISFFAIAHIIYILSFARHFGRVAESKDKILRIILCTFILAYSVTASRMLLSEINNEILHIAGAVYLVIISIMAFGAIIQRRENHWLYVAGAVLFMISDSILAYRIFCRPFPGAGNYVMITYYAAQMMLNINFVKNEKAL